MKPSGSVVAWTARVAWLLVAVLGGAAVEGAVSERSAAVRLVCGIGSWTLWGVVMLALAVPSVRSLTISRVVGPISILVAAGTALFGAGAVDVLLLAVPAIVAVAATFTAEFGRHNVQASSYGDEERLPLRMPVAAGTAAAVLWFPWATAAIAGPLLLAARSWLVGAIVTAVSIAGAVFIGPRWHRLSRRWLVLVPAGLVVHDPVVLADTMMLRTDQVAMLRLAPADTQAADLTGPASGYALEVSATETVTTVFAFTPQDPGGRALHLTALLVSPSRPGEALRLASGRGLRVT